MADILISKFTTQIPRVGATPATPGFAESEGQDPVNPSGSPLVYTPVTIGSPANGLSIDGSQVLTIGLASTSATGALSSTDWNTFNNKQNALTNPVTGTGTSGQVAFWNGTTSQSGSNNLFWDNTNGRLGIGTNAPSYRLHNVGSAGFDNGNSGDAITILNNGFIQMASTRMRGFGFGFVFQDNAFNTRVSLSMSGSHSVFNTGGNFTFGSGADAGFRLDVNGTGRIQTSLMVGSAASATNTLDVNGTARIRTISNLGTSATSVLVPSATGVVSLRTLAEFRGDLGATTLGSNLFTIPNPSSITFPRFNADNTVSALSASDFRTSIGAMADEANERASNTVLFDKDYIIGNAGARTGNILFDFTGAKLGSTTLMIHDNSGSYTFPAEGEIRNFETAKLALVTGNVTFGFTLINKTVSSEAVYIDVSLTESQLIEYNA